MSHSSSCPFCLSDQRENICNLQQSVANVSVGIVHAGNFLITCSSCCNKFYHSSRLSFNLPAEPVVTCSLTPSPSGNEVITNFRVGLPDKNDTNSWFKRLSFQSKLSWVEASQSRIRGNRPKSKARHITPEINGIRGLAEIANSRAVRRDNVSDERHMEMGAKNYEFPRDSRILDSMNNIVEELHAIHNTPAQGYMLRIGEAHVRNHTYGDKENEIDVACNMHSGCACNRMSCKFANASKALSASDDQDEYLQRSGPLLYDSIVNGAKGKAFLDTGVIGLPENVDRRTAPIYISKRFAKLSGLKTIDLIDPELIKEPITLDRPPAFDITVANDSKMRCDKMVKNVRIKIGRYKDIVDAFIVPSEQFDIILGRQWLRMRRPQINHDDDSLCFKVKLDNGSESDIVVPLSGMPKKKKSSRHNAALSYDSSDSTTVHTTFGHFWSSYRNSREYIVDRQPIMCLRITKKVLDAAVEVEDNDNECQFDAPDNQFIGDPTLDKEQPFDMKNEYKGSINNRIHPLVERPCATDLDHIIWSEFGEDGTNLFPQEIPNFGESGVVLSEPIIKLVEGHEQDFPCRMTRKLNIKEQQELLSQIQFYMDKGWIQPSSSPYGAAILFVPKKNGKLRMCIDYRNLNKITKKDKYPLPDADLVIEQLQGARHFSQLDLSHGYHQLKLHPDDIPKTTFRSLFGAYEWKVLTFGLTNAVPAFVRIMNTILHPFLGKCAMVFIDDIIIYSKTKEQHVEDVRNVLKAIQAYKMFVNWPKSAFDVDKVEYLGHIISKEGLRPFDDKVKYIKDWERPTNVYHLRSFLGAVGYYRKFIHNFAKIARPLTELTRQNPDRPQAVASNVTMTKWGREMKTHKFLRDEWTDECEQAFITLREALTKHPVLLLPDPDKPYEIMIDASGAAIGAVLMQRDDNNQLHPVAFYSSKHTPAEANYAVHEFELLAIFKSLKHWRHLLINSLKTKIYTDHKPLTHLLSQPHLSQRQSRWITYLADYDVDIQAVAGTANKVADCLSRYNYEKLTSVVNKLTEEYVHDVSEEFFSFMERHSTQRYHSALGFHHLSHYPHQVMWASAITSTLSSIRSLSHLASLKFSGVPQIFGGGAASVVATISSSDIKKYVLQAYETDPIAKQVMQPHNPFPDLKVVDKLIIHFDRDGHETLYIPATAMVRSSKLVTEFPVEGETVRNTCTLREEIIRQIHNNGHIGAGKTIEQITRNYYWPKLRLSVLDFVRGCMTCQKNKQITHKQYGKLRTLELPTRRWAYINMDFITGLPKTKSGYDSILVVIDQYSKRAHFIPTTEEVSAKQTAMLFYNHIWKLHGLPIKIVSDRDTRFISDFWKSLFAIFGTQLAMSTPYHPNTDGLAERTNLTLKEMLRSYTDNARFDWDVYLSAAEFQYNNTKNTSTQKTPFQVDTNQHPLDPHNVAVTKILDNIGDVRVADGNDKESKHFIERWHDNLKIAKQALTEAQENLRIKHLPFRKQVDEGLFQVGKKVWLDGANIKYPDAKSKPAGQLKRRKTLDTRRLGPYEILQVIGDGTAFKLKVPPHQKFHPVQPISVLEPVKYSSEFLGAHNEDPCLPVVSDVDGKVELEFEVEKILRHRKYRGKNRYLVKFLGYDDTHNEWLSEKDLENASEYLEEYKRENNV